MCGCSAFVLHSSAPSFRLLVEDMRKPRALVSGDRIAIVAPASPFDRDSFQAGVVEIEELGFEPVLTEGVFARRGYLAGDAATRAAALMSAWRDPSVAAVIAARGGYGSAQLLPLLDRDIFLASSKLFIGHSDVTALLGYLTLQCDTTCLHGPMVVNLGSGEPGYDQRSLRRCLMQTDPLGELTTDQLIAFRPGDARGPLLGGTLTQLVASLGTAYAFAPPEGFVLLLDEIGERPYRLDRMLTQLAGSGVLDRAAAIVCGEFPACDEPAGRATARAMLAELLDEFPGPALFGLPTGHTTGPALTVPLGVEVRVVGDSRARVVVTEAPVS